MRVCVLCVAFLMIGLIVNAQQDPQFSQNMFNHMTINPAFAGLEQMGDLRDLPESMAGYGWCSGDICFEC